MKIFSSLNQSNYLFLSFESTLLVVHFILAQFFHTLSVNSLFWAKESNLVLTIGAVCGKFWCYSEFDVQPWWV